MRELVVLDFASVVELLLLFGLFAKWLIIFLPLCYILRWAIGHIFRVCNITTICVIVVFTIIVVIFTALFIDITTGSRLNDLLSVSWNIVSFSYARLTVSKIKHLPSFLLAMLNASEFGARVNSFSRLVLFSGG